MRLEALVGKKVMRIAPMGKDRSFMSTDYITEVLEIVNGIPLAKITYDFLDNTKIKDLVAYNDDNWIDATDVFDRLDKLRNELNNHSKD